MNEQDLIIAIKADNAQLNAKLAESTAALKNLKGSAQTGMGGVNDSMIGAIAKAGAVAVAVTGIGYALLQVSEKGSSVSKLENSFNALCKSVGATGDQVLASLQKASGGAIDNVEIMKEASQAIKLMGEDSISTLPELMNIAVAAAATTGESVAKSFSDVVTATARQSIEILDNVGISANDTKKYIDEYARSMGKTADTLDDAGKKAAFLYAVQKAGGDIVSRQGGDVNGLVTGYDRMCAAWQNLSDVLAKSVNPVLDALEQRIASMLTTIAKVVEAPSSMTSALGEAREAIANIKIEMAEVQESFDRGRKGDLRWWEGGLEYWEQRLTSLKKDLAYWEQRAAELDKKVSVSPSKKTDSGGMSAKEQEEQVKKRIAIESEYWTYVTNSQNNVVVNDMATAGLLMQNQMWLLEQRMISEQEYSDNIASISEELANRQIIAVEQQAESERVATENLYLAKAGFRSREYSATAQMFDNLATLQQAHDKRLFRIGQAAAIARAVMNIAEGVTKALSYGPILGPLLASTVVAAGAVQIATIASQQYASGSVGSVASQVSTPSTEPSNPTTTTTTSSTTAKAKEEKYARAINPYGDNIKQFASGTMNVPSDMYAYIHKSEIITPKTFSESVRSGEAAMISPEFISNLASQLKSSGGGDTNIIVQGSVVDAKGLLDIVDAQRSRKARNMAMNDYNAQSVY